MAPPTRHTRATGRGDGALVARDAEDDLTALRLGRPERWVLDQVRRHGVTGFVATMTAVAVVASVALVAVMMAVLYGPDDPTFGPALAMAVTVPALVAPPVLLFSVRLAAALDRAAYLLWEAAHTDPLTEVANRRAFFDTVDRRDGPLDDAFDVAIADLDAFKAVNDRFGHSGGDLALRQVAGWLVELAGPGGLVARMGGDEFALVVPVERDGGRPTKRSFDHDGLQYSVTLGWARCEAGGSLDDALRDADLALYAHKPGGRSPIGDDVAHADR